MNVPGFYESPLVGFGFDAITAGQTVEGKREVLRRHLSAGSTMREQLLLAHGAWCAEHGHVPEAVDAFRMAALSLPSQPDGLQRLIRLADSLSKPVGARWQKAFQKSFTARAITLSTMLEEEADRFFGGSDHYEVLRYLGELTRPRLYFEIGVAVGGSLDVCFPDADKIAVDPAPGISADSYERFRLFVETSDAFFSHAEEAFAGRSVDLAFIDGLHEAGQLLRDFRETERWMAPNGTIVLHDVLPLHSISALPQRKLRFWVGDCWRVLATLVRERPDLKISIVPAYPSGLAIIRGLDPQNRDLFDRMDKLVRDMAELDISRDYLPAVLDLDWVEPTKTAIDRVLVSGSGSGPGWAVLGMSEEDWRSMERYRAAAV